MKTCIVERRGLNLIMLQVVACLCFLLSKSVSCEVFTNSFFVKLHGAPGNEVASQIAQRNGFENVGPILKSKSEFNFVHRALPHARSKRSVPHMRKLKVDPSVHTAVQQSGFKRVKRGYKPLKVENLVPDIVTKESKDPTDPYFPYQWYLKNTGQNGGKAKLDLNVEAAWAQGVTGRNVTTAIMDDGVDYMHMDLKNNYNAKASYDFSSNDPYPYPRYTDDWFNSHGTRCAGEVSAARDNGVCGVGVAYDSKIAGKPRSQISSRARRMVDVLRNVDSPTISPLSTPADDSDADPSYTPSKEMDSTDYRHQNVVRRLFPNFDDKDEDTLTAVSPLPDTLTSASPLPHTLKAANPLPHTLKPASPKDVDEFSNSGSEDSDSDEEDESDNDDESQEEVPKNITIVEEGHFCFYCRKHLLTKMSRHLVRKHSKEPELKEILKNLKDKSISEDIRQNLVDKKNNIVSLLTRKGDFFKNSETLRTQSGFLRLVRTQNEHVKIKNYIFCSQCYGMYGKKNLKRHMKTCPYKHTTRPTSSSSLSVSKALMFNILQIDDLPLDQTFKEEILADMNADEIFEILSNDKDILRLGMYLFKKYGPEGADTIRANMRRMARLVQVMRHDLKSDKLTCREILLPHQFDSLLKAVRTLSKESENSDGLYGAPSFAKNVKYTLQKCLATIRGNLLRQCSFEQDKVYQATLSLIQDEWYTQIGAKATRTFTSRLKNKPQIIPLTNDLQVLTEHVERKLEETIGTIQETFNAKTWFSFCKLALVRILLFNRRRSGEMASLLIEDFERSVSNMPISDEAFKTLSESEKKLSAKLDLIEITGKRNNVPVILTPSMRKHLELILRLRKDNNLNMSNKYFFPSTTNSKKHLRGSDILRQIVNNAGLQRPNDVTGTSLRKYLAVACQILNLNENELDSVAKHMGHDLFVHRKFYRLQEGAIELAKVSKLLILMDKGKLHEQAGATLNELEVRDDDPIFSEEEQEEEREAVKPKQRSPAKQKIKTNVFTVSPSTGKNKGRIVGTVSDRTVPVLPFKKKSGKNPWSTSEAELVLSAFHSQITKATGEVHYRSLPSKDEILSFLERTKIQREWKVVKDFIRNRIDRYRTLTKKN